MFDNNATIHVGTLERVCNELNVDQPPKYLAALADAERVKTALADIGGPDTAQRLAAAAFAAALAGKDPLDDKAVQRLATLQQLELGGIYPAAEQQRRDMIAEAVTANADYFTEKWADAVSGVGELLAETAGSDVFSDVPILNEMRPAELIDPEAHRMFVAATTAARRLDAAANGFGALMAATGLNYRPESKVMVLGSGITLAELTTAITDRDLLDNRKTADAWRLARAGITPRIHRTLADFVATVSRINSEQTQREAEAEPDQRKRHAALAGQRISR